MWNRLKKYRIRKQTGKHVRFTKIRRLMRQTKLNDALLESTGKIEVYWIYACKKIEAVRKQAKELNGIHLLILD